MPILVFSKNKIKPEGDKSEWKPGRPHFFISDRGKRCSRAFEDDPGHQANIYGNRKVYMGTDSLSYFVPRMFKGINQHTESSLEMNRHLVQLF